MCFIPFLGWYEEIQIFTPQCKKTQKTKHTPRRINPFAQKYLVTIYYVSHMKNEKPFSHRIYSLVRQALYTNEWLFCVQSGTGRRGSCGRCHISHRILRVLAPETISTTYRLWDLGHPVLWGSLSQFPHL